MARFGVVTQPDQVRARIGLTGQYAAIDELLKGESGAGGEPLARSEASGSELSIAAGSDLEAAARAAQPFGQRPAEIDSDAGRLTLPISGGAALLPSIVRALDGAGARLADLALRKPTLDDVFLALTGQAATRHIEEEAA